MEKFTTQVKEAEIVALCDTHQENLDRYQLEILIPSGRAADVRQL